jgi:hypothetical protein
LGFAARNTVWRSVAFDANQEADVFLFRTCSLASRIDFDRTKAGKNSPLILGLLMPWDLKLDDRLSWTLQHSSLRIYPGALDGYLPWITGGRHGASNFLLICFCNTAAERVSCRFAQGS